MATKVDICNSALDKLGVEPVESLSDENKQARLCNRQYDVIRKKLLRSHLWNFAITRTVLAPAKDSNGDPLKPVFGSGFLYDIPSDSLRITRLGDGRSTNFDSVSERPHVIEGQQILAYEANEGSVVNTDDGTTLTVSGTTGDITITAKDNTGTNIDTFWDSRNFGAKVEITIGATTGVATVTSLLGDNVQSATVNATVVTAFGGTTASSDWQITNFENIPVMYIKDEEEVDNMDSTFQEALSWKLAAELAYSLIHSGQIATLMEQKATIELKDTRSFDSFEGTPDEWDSDSWNAARTNRSGLNRRF